MKQIFYTNFCFQEVRFQDEFHNVWLRGYLKFEFGPIRIRNYPYTNCFIISKVINLRQNYKICAAFPLILNPFAFSGNQMFFQD